MPRSAMSCSVHEQHAALVVDAAVPVVVLVDGGVELVVAAHGHQHQLVGLQVVLFQRGSGEVGLAVFGGELPLAGAVGQVEAAGLAQLLVEVLEARNHAGNVVADDVVVLRHGHPVGNVGSVAERGNGHAADDGYFAQHLARPAAPARLCSGSPRPWSFRRTSSGGPTSACRCRACVKQGSSRLVSPVTRWPRLSLVPTYTVSFCLRMPSAITSVSGPAASRLPPRLKYTLVLPSTWP